MRAIKKLLRLLLWALIFLYLAVALLPKEALFYQAERALEPMHIFINEKEVSDRLFSVTLEDATLLYQDVEAATAEGITLTTLLVYNSLSVTPFRINEDLAGFIPPGIEKLRITHHLFMPHRIRIEAAGDFGTAIGYADLLERRLRIDITFSSLVNRDYPALLKMVRKDTEGYYYEYTF